MGKYCLSLGLCARIAVAVLVVVSTLAVGATGEDGAGTNFFLKASKSVPRIGRRSEYDNFFLKASKSVPRIGRRRELSPLTEGRDWGNVPWFRTSDNIPGPSRRADYYIHEGGPPAHPLSWNDVEKTMEESPELWKPDLWRKNNENFPLRDEFDIQHIVRRSTGPFNKDNTKRETNDEQNLTEI
ncbi:hypothetical protein C0J52_24369 [Blattella germanica]|nr:hypothetical protein C0J52_24369 [Blattella germanica]